MSEQQTLSSNTNKPDSSNESDFISPQQLPINLKLPTRLHKEITILPCIEDRHGCYDSNKNHGICSGELKKIPAKAAAEILCAAWPVDPANTFAHLSSLSNQKIAYIFASSYNAANCGEIMRMFAHLHPERFAEAILFLKEPPEHIARKAEETEGKTGFAILKFLHPEQRENVLAAIAKTDKNYATCVKEFNLALRDKSNKSAFSYVQGKVSPKSNFTLIDHETAEVPSEIKDAKYVNKNEYIIDVTSETDKNILAAKLGQDSIVLCLQIPSHQTRIMFHFSAESNPVDALDELKSILTNAEINIKEDATITLVGGSKGSQTSERLLHFIRKGLANIGVEYFNENTLLSKNLEQSTITFNSASGLIELSGKKQALSIAQTSNEYQYLWDLDPLKCVGNNLYSLSTASSNINSMPIVEAEEAMQVIQLIKDESFFKIVGNKEGAENSESTLENIRSLPGLLEAIDKKLHLADQNKQYDLANGNLLELIEKLVTDDQKTEDREKLMSMLRSSKILWSNIRTYYIGTKEQEAKRQENIERKREENIEKERRRKDPLNNKPEGPPVLKV